MVFLEASSSAVLPGASSGDSLVTHICNGLVPLDSTSSGKVPEQMTPHFLICKLG